MGIEMPKGALIIGNPSRQQGRIGTYSKRTAAVGIGLGTRVFRCKERARKKTRPYANSFQERGNVVDELAKGPGSAGNDFCRSWLASHGGS